MGRAFEGQVPDRETLETRAGRRFGHRSLVFFAILLTLAVVTFGAIRKFSASS